MNTPGLLPEKNNSSSVRNAGAELWDKAKTLIPGGGQLLSKRAEMFLPDNWPAYYKRAKGAEVWDMNDLHYYDMSIMGMGTCVLGYANEEVNRAVKEAIDQGSMCTLNSYEEVALAEKLIELHPWARKVRYARTGGEACSIAVRIGRAAAKKDRVLFCGYHGWADWYISANLGNEKHLDGQLIPGLGTDGLPRALKDTSLPFMYGDIAGFEKLVLQNENEIGVIIMEFARNSQPNIEFLKKVQQTARRIGAVLIYDEVTSGFRMRTGGMHMLYGIEPDIVILGKALGNGYPIAAIAGRAEVMEAAQGTFISSTFWTERIGFVAALETIRQYEKLNVPEYLQQAGEKIALGLQKIFAQHGLKINIVGLRPSVTLSIQEEMPLVVKTLFTQEMLKRGYLASTLIYVSIAHTDKVIDGYLKAVEEVSAVVAQAKQNGNLESLLEGPVCHSGFKRLN